MVNKNFCQVILSFYFSWPDPIVGAQSTFSGPGRGLCPSPLQFLGGRRCWSRAPPCLPKPSFHFRGIPARKDLQWHPTGILTGVPSMGDLQWSTLSLQSRQILRYVQISQELMIWFLKKILQKSHKPFVQHLWLLTLFKQRFFLNRWYALSKCFFSLGLFSRMNIFTVLPGR